MNITTYEMNRILNHVFTGGTGGSFVYTSGSFYLGLSTTSIASDGTGVTEPPEAYGYARSQIPSKITHWDGSELAGNGSANGELISKIDQMFTATAGAWGTIRAVFLATGSGISPAVTAGSICYYYTLPTSIPVLPNSTVTFTAGSIVVSMA